MLTRDIFRGGVGAVAIALVVVSGTMAAAQDVVDAPDSDMQANLRVCMYPVQLAEVDSTDPRLVGIQEQIIEKLSAAGLVIRDPVEVAAKIKSYRETFGAYYDSVFGRDLPGARERFLEGYAALLQDDLNCDAVMRASIVVLQADFVGGTAWWDGVEQTVNSAGLTVLNVLGGVSESGWVGALSIWLSVHDRYDREIAFRSAGIETFVRRSVSKGVDLLPKDVWLTDQKRIDAALALALGPRGTALWDPADTTRAEDLRTGYRDQPRNR